MSARPTKERILEAAETLMLAKSFHSVGLNEILREVKVPKGSFYHYFASKEQFGVELLKHYVDRASAKRRQMLLTEGDTGDSRARLLAYLDTNIDCFRENGGHCPCLVEKLASEVVSFSEPMREVLAEGRREWVQIVAQAIREGRESRCIGWAVGEPIEVAELVECLWTGAMHHALLDRNSDTLTHARRFIGDSLIPAPA